MTRLRVRRSEGPGKPRRIALPESPCATKRPVRCCPASTWRAPPDSPLVARILLSGRQPKQEGPVNAPPAQPVDRTLKQGPRTAKARTGKGAVGDGHQRAPVPGIAPIRTAHRESPALSRDAAARRAMAAAARTPMPLPRHAGCVGPAHSLYLPFVAHLPA